HGLNIEGMRRKGWSKQTIDYLRQAYRVIFRSGLTKEEAIVAVTEQLLPQEPLVQLLLDSLIHSERGLVR
ncbi:MAG: acyl-[acyl-carrier-protein]--UDP-N-acetylglucosamine O-acyltransferase, partial [Moraxella osloensis]|nr:acyl-[acyl-carrier-protein]--UDP-N-acetylglucosamine O-acyltransferase [Moraxella osloensis]